MTLADGRSTLPCSLRAYLLQLQARRLDLLHYVHWLPYGVSESVAIFLLTLLYSWVCAATHSLSTPRADSCPQSLCHHRINTS